MGLSYPPMMNIYLSLLLGIDEGEKTKKRCNQCFFLVFIIQMCYFYVKE